MPATKSPKSLSGATMGMRFMQRKTASAQQQQQQQQPQHSTKAWTEYVQLQQQHKEARKDQTTETSDDFFKPQINQPLNVASCSTSTSQIQQPQTINNDNLGAKGDTNHKINVPMIASAGDMYGISGVIIGRRSFNNFHKTVEDTWLNAVKSFSQSSKLHDETDEKQQQITDEELLQRYEKYVKGRGEMVDKKEKSIGNLSKKKRKRT